MKLLITIIRPEKLRDVRKSLSKEKISIMTVIDVRGAGQQKGFVEEYRGVVETVDLHRKAMLLMALNDSFVDTAVKAIIKGARSNGGITGDGKIFIVNLEDCIRIRSGEKGIAAIGGDSKELTELKKKGKVKVIKV